MWINRRFILVIYDIVLQYFSKDGVVQCSVLFSFNLATQLQMSNRALFMISKFFNEG